MAQELPEFYIDNIFGKDVSGHVDRTWTGVVMSQQNNLVHMQASWTYFKNGVYVRPTSKTCLFLIRY